MATQPFDFATTTAANRSEARQVDWLEAIWAPRVLSIVRIVTGLIFMEHGTQKWLNFRRSDARRRSFSRCPASEACLN